MTDDKASTNWSGPIVLAVIALVGLIIWRGGFEGLIEPDNPPHSDDKIAELASESRNDFTAAEAANLRQIAKGLRKGEFKRVKDAVTKLNKLNNDDGAAAWAAFGKAMQKFDGDKDDGLKEAADYMDATADGLERHSGK